MRGVPSDALPDDAGRGVLAELCDAALQYLAMATDIEFEAWRRSPASLADKWRLAMRMMAGDVRDEEIASVFFGGLPCPAGGGDAFTDAEAATDDAEAGAAPCPACGGRLAKITKATTICLRCGGEWNDSGESPKRGCHESALGGTGWMSAETCIDNHQFGDHSKTGRRSVS